MKIALFLILEIISGIVLSQTYINGGIYSNATWSKINSPYIVTGNVVLFPDKTLTIEPGVEVKFDGYFSIEVRGHLEAIGTANDSIKFVSNISQAKNAWDNIEISNMANGSGKFDYCAFRNSNNGVIIHCCTMDSSTFILRSKFENNNTGLGPGYSGTYLSIDSCLFSNNIVANAGTNSIYDCVFENNETAINSFQVYYIINSQFRYNGIAITNGVYDINNCTIVENNVGVSSVGNGQIKNNIISNNSIGIQSHHDSYAFNGIQYYLPIFDNQICDNLTYNFENMNNYNKTVTQNCFCTNDSIEIENKLFDGFDDITRGLVNYAIYDTACLNVVQSIFKIGSPSDVNSIISDNNLFTVYPNPVDDILTVVFNNRLKTSSEIHLYNSVGENIISTIYNQNGILKLNFNEFSNGLYLLEIKNESVVKKEKIIKL